MAKGKKTGGRVAGVPNKPKTPEEARLKESIHNNSVDYFTKPIAGDIDHRTQFQIDMDALAPDDRVMAQLKLLNKSVPDLKSVDANINTHNVTLTIEDRLRELCEEDED